MGRESNRTPATARHVHRLSVLAAVLTITLYRAFGHCAPHLALFGD